MVRVGLVGDVANSFALLNIVFFLALVLANYYGYFNYASRSFLRDGFCVSWPGTLYDSHFLAFYIDTVCAFILAYLSKKYAGMAGFDTVKFAPAGVLIHGLAHLGIATNTSSAASESTGPTLIELLAQLVGLFMFYFFLVRSAQDAPNGIQIFALNLPIFTTQ